MAQTVGEIVCTVSAQWSPNPLTRGDRVRIREGYERNGTVGYYWGKSRDDADKVVIDWDRDKHVRASVLAAAIEPYPYTKDERIERLLEDYDGVLRTRCDTALFPEEYAPDLATLTAALADRDETAETLAIIGGERDILLLAVDDYKAERKRLRALLLDANNRADEATGEYRRMGDVHNAYVHDPAFVCVPREVLEKHANQEANNNFYAGRKGLADHILREYGKEAK